MTEFAPKSTFSNSRKDKVMFTNDETGEKFEKIDVAWDKAPPDTVLYALRPIEKSKWRVTDQYMLGKSEIFIDLDDIHADQAQLIKDCCEALMELINTTEASSSPNEEELKANINLDRAIEVARNAIQKGQDE